MTHRTGWLVRAEADGLTGFGDCAPLPEAGTEEQTPAKHRLDHWRRRATDCSGEILLAELDAEGQTLAPAADCAVEAALLDLDARRQGLPLRRCLGQGLGQRLGPALQPAADRVQVNAMLGAAASLADADVDAALGAGYRVLKLKVGVEPLDVEMARIERTVARLPPGVLLRLDANGAWDEPTAAAWIERLAGLPIDCIEEPLAKPDDAALARLQGAAPFSLALDESLAARGQVDPAALPVRRLVLKPSALGGLRRTLGLAEQARGAGLEPVLTSLVESAAGLWATAQLAAATASPLAHGLATADWLAADLGAPPIITPPWLALPDLPGSGFTPDAIILDGAVHRADFYARR